MHQTTSATLIPPPATAKAERRTRFAAAFGPRFFLLTLVGLAWLGAAFQDPRFCYAMAAWAGIALIAWAVDLASLPKPKQRTVTRRWHSAAALSVGHNLNLVRANASRGTLF